MKKYLISFNFFLLILMPLSAHPHIISVIYPYIYFDETGMTGFYIQWYYDPIFSSQIIYDVDADMNLELDEYEETEARNILFSMLDRESWFMTIDVNDEKVSVPEPMNFSVDIDKEDETLMFTYYIPLPLEYRDEGINVKIEFTDPSQYTAFKILVKELEPIGWNACLNSVEINYSGIVAFNFSQ